MVLELLRSVYQKVETLTEEAWDELQSILPFDGLSIMDADFVFSEDE